MEQERLILENKKDSELKELAIDLYENKIFTSLHFSEEDVYILPNVFMVIGLGGLAKYPKEDIEQIGLIYEYYTEAGPRSVNGFPIFMSMKLLNKSDAHKMFGYYEDYKTVKEKFVGKGD